MTEKDKKKLNLVYVNLIENFDLAEGLTYKITDVKYLVTDDGDAVKLSCVNSMVDDGKNYQTLLWIKEEVGVNSKLGSFMKAFNSADVNTWIGKKFFVKKWQTKNREIETR